MYDDSDAEDGIMCIDMIIPCPEECPESCVYPMNLACPYIHQPSCPKDVVSIDPSYSCQDVDGFPLPTIPIISTPDFGVVCPFVFYEW
ncbi:hypothetical protein CLU79DRAFT_710249 [Phycomyces nitens]|nr:hypothetical protein CLU79DRAFT_710249 [Phycomyces nitens]